MGATKLTEEALESKKRKAELVEKLRNIDKPTNCISYICALMEKVSDSRGILTASELKKYILEDMLSLRDFFKAARIAESDEFILDFLYELKGEPIEIKRAEYLNFLNALNTHFNLRNPVSGNKRLGIASEIIHKAKSLDICAQHPVVSIALACLYGNRSAKKLMKFKEKQDEFDADNVLADIMFISRFAKIKLEIEHLGRNKAGYMRVEFITDDGGLTELSKCFKPKTVKHNDTDDGRQTQLVFAVDIEKLFPDATEMDCEALANLLN